jgi:hypothetical protein
MSKLEDIAFRVEWFKRQSEALTAVSKDIGLVVESVFPLTIDPDIRYADGGLRTFAEAYAGLHAKVATDLYPQGVAATAATAELLHLAGRNYAQTEAANHDLVASVAKLLENY